MTTRAKWKLAAALVAVAVMAVVGRELPLLAWLSELAATIRSLGAWGVGLYALIFAIAAMLCIPCMPLTLAGGFIFGTIAGVTAVHSGTVLGAAGGFLAGRWLGRAHVAEWLRRSERFHYLDEEIAREGWKVVGLLRLLPIPFGASNYLYGMTGLKFWHYLLATAVAMLPGNAIFAHLGSAGGRMLGDEGEIHPLEWVALGLGAASLIALGVLLPKILKKRRHSEPSESAQAQETATRE